MIRPYDAPYTPHIASGIVLVGGCFDVLHYGHLVFLQKAKALGDYLIVALEHDGVILGSKNRTAFHTHLQRAALLNALSMVDEVILLPDMNAFDDYLSLVQRINPTVIAYTQGDSQAQNKEKQAALIGAKAVSITFEQGFSTTDLLEKYRQG